jgi:hypothetical protein
LFNHSGRLLGERYYSIQFKALLDFGDNQGGSAISGIVSRRLLVDRDPEIERGAHGVAPAKVVCAQYINLCQARYRPQQPRGSATTVNDLCL